MRISQRKAKEYFMRLAGRFSIPLLLAATLFFAGSCSWILPIRVYDQDDKQEKSPVDCRIGPALADTVTSAAELLAGAAVWASTAVRSHPASDYQSDGSHAALGIAIPLLGLAALHAFAAINGWVKYRNCKDEVTKFNLVHDPSSPDPRGP